MSVPIGILGVSSSKNTARFRDEKSAAGVSESESVTERAPVRPREKLDGIIVRADVRLNKGYPEQGAFSAMCSNLAIHVGLDK